MDTTEAVQYHDGKAVERRASRSQKRGGIEVPPGVVGYQPRSEEGAVTEPQERTETKREG